MTGPRRQIPPPLLVGDCAVLPPWAAAWLERSTNLAVRRIAARGQDPGLDHVLNVIRYAASLDPGFGSAPGSDHGTSAPVLAEPVPTLELPLETVQAAALLGVTSRAVRRAIAEGRLPANRVGGRWLIARDDVARYQPRSNLGRTA